MPIEYEHRYLVDTIPDNHAIAQHITQNYIGVHQDRSLVQRIRKVTTDFANPRFLETHKIGRDPEVHEVEHDIPEDSYNELLEFFTIGSHVRKIHRIIEIDGLKWDVDQFENGMIIAELEDPPDEYSLDEFGKSVNLSEIAAFKNFNIALNGYPEFQHLLDAEN